ncbi:hypothetical protein LV779_33830 [Streptomyces thinghirensis]|nr:hypothetical protein [Streptomyces thinghirensis]
MAAATIGLVPALADSGDPDLPKVTAEQLIEKIAKSDVEQLSGTVKISTDLGLPDLGGLESGLMSGMSGGPVPGGGRGRLRRRPVGQAHRAGVRHPHAAGRRRRPRPAEAVAAGERRRVQPDSRRQGTSGATTASPTRSTTPPRPRQRRAAGEGRCRPPRRTSPTRPSRRSTTPRP